MGNHGKKEKKNKSSFLKQLPLMACFIAIGVVCGLLIGKVMGTMIKEEKDTGNVLLAVAVLFLGMYFGIFLQIVIHEAGHLLFGLLSGYRFSSFRIGSFMWLKEDGKLKKKRMSLAGTGGQCLMSPPEMIDGKIPYALYNLGGSISNAVAALICLILYLILRQIPYLSTILLMFAIIGFAEALINGIPMRLGTVDNDGYNALSLGKSKEALRSFWVQMQANALIAKGMRIKDMPEEWFTVPTKEGMKNSMTAVMGVFACSRLMDEKRFEEADALMEQLLSADTGIVDLHRNMMLCDRIFCELIEECRKEQVEELYTKELENFMKSMKKYPSILRTEYVYALLYEKDEEKAKTLLEQFEKVAKNYPYESDIESERELMEIAKNKAKTE